MTERHKVGHKAVEGCPRDDEEEYETRGSLKPHAHTA